MIEEDRDNVGNMEVVLVYAKVLEASFTSGECTRSRNQTIAPNGNNCQKVIRKYDKSTLWYMEDSISLMSVQS